ncbi:MAG: hypothetical protein KF734_06335 [Saprospiraceae bacterium]|nr:hypothetical protein [Saprospiraceae bacterium]
MKALKIKKVGDKGVEPAKGSIINFFFPNLWHTHIFVMTIAEFSKAKIGNGYFNER